MKLPNFDVVSAGVVIVRDKWCPQNVEPSLLPSLWPFTTQRVRRAAGTASPRYVVIILLHRTLFLSARSHVKHFFSSSLLCPCAKKEKV